MLTNREISTVLAFGVATLISAGLTVAVRSCVLTLGWVDSPREARWHREPTPLFGGVAVVSAFFLSSAILGLTAIPEFRLLAVPGLAVFLLGAADDKWKLSPPTKFLVQTAAAIYVIAQGLRLPLTQIPVLDSAVTLVWIVGVTNAFNLIDNMNGLCAGIGIVTAMIRGTVFLHDHNTPGFLLCCTLAGALVGFLFFNFPKARIFLGDGGSLFVGFWLSALALTNVRSFANNYVAVLLFPLLAMLVPISDTTLVTITRTLRRQPVSVGGRDHFSHRLVAYGLTETSAVMLLWTLSLASGALAVLLTFSGVKTVYTLAGLVIIGLAMTGANLAGFAYDDHCKTRVPRRLQVVLSITLDVCLAVVAYYTAYVVRFDGSVSGGDFTLFLRTAGVVVATKIVAFVASGIYRQWMRYFALEDALAIVAASGVASLFCTAYFAFVYRSGFSRLVLLMDFLLFSVLAVAFRSSFRLFERFAPMAERQRALIIGADARGEIALHIIRERFTPVGFIDSDNLRKRLRIRSVPVLGSIEDIEAMVEKHRIDVVITTSDNAAELKLLQELCRQTSTLLFKLPLTLEEVLDRASEAAEAEEHAAVSAVTPDSAA